MKNLFRKDKPINKLIALWLVFIMMLVPLVSHMGSKRGAKAAGTPTALSIASDVDFSAMSLQFSTQTLEDSSNSPVTEDGINGINVNPKDYYFDVDDNSVGPNVALSYSNLQVESLTIDGNGYNIEETYYIIKNGNAQYYASNIPSDSVDSVALTDGSAYSLYVKFKLKNTNDDTEKVTCYTRIATYTFTQTDAFATNPTWVDENGTDTDPNKWYKPANVWAAGATTEFNGDGTHTEYLGVVKYAFAKYVDGKNTYSEYTSMTKGWTKAAEGVNLTNRSSGSYIGFIGYFGSDSDTEPMKVQSIGVVKVDLGNPYFVSAAQGGYLYYCENDWNNFDPADSDTYTEAVGIDKEIIVSEVSKYRYYVKFKDWDDESGISKVYIKQGSNTEDVATKVTINGEDYWYCDAKLLEDSDKIYTWATDVAGNTSKQDNGEELVGLVKEFHPKYELVWTYNGSSYAMGSDEPTSAAQIFVGPNKNLILNMTLSTEKEVGSIVVKATVNGSEREIKTIDSIASTGSGPYSCNATIDFADEIEEDAFAISKITIGIYDTQGNPLKEALATDPIWYDGTAPIITYSPGDGWYTNLADAESLSCSVTSGDKVDESHLDSAVIKVGNTETSMTINGATATGTVDFTDDSSSVDGTDVTIVAVDKAGNKTTKEYKVKIDTEKPEITNSALYVNSDGRALDGTKVNNTDSIKFTTTDNLAIQKIEYIVSDGTNSMTYTDDNMSNSSPVTSLNVVKSLTQDLYISEDGDYTLTVKVYDMAGLSEIVSATFTYDASAPTLSSVGLKIGDTDALTGVISFKNAVTTTHKISAEGDRFYIRKSDSNVYYYLLVVEDDGKIDVDKLKTASLPAGLEVVTDIDTVDDNTYEFAIKINNSALDANSGLNPSGLKIYDDTGNYLELLINPSIYAVDESIHSKATLCNADGSVVDLSNSELVDELANGTSKQYYVRMDVTSPDAVTNVELKNNATSYKSTTEGTNSQDYVTQLYTHESFIALPTDKNIHFDEWFAQVTINGVTYNTLQLTELLYDKTNPVLKGVESNIVWNKDANIEYNIVSGTDSSVESNLAKVVVNITNSNNDTTSSDLADGTKQSVSGTISVPESKTVAGTNVKFTALDNAGNPFESPNYTFLVDKTSPKVDSLGVVVNDVFIDTTKPTTGTPIVLTGVSDNLTLSEVSIAVVYPDGTTIKGQTFSYDDDKALAEGTNGVKETLGYTLEPVNGVVPDGIYYATVTAKDKATNESITKELYFTLDNTLPVVTAKVVSGTTAGKAPVTAYDGSTYDNYYSSDVNVQLTYTDANKKDIVVTDNGTEIEPKWSFNDYGQYVATLTVSAEGGHNIVINGTDVAGGQAAPCSVSFYIDKQAPTITTVLNGGLVYTESMGKLKMTSDTGLSASVSDVTEDIGDLNVQIIKAVPDQPVSAPAYIKTTVRQFAFTDEADYTINLFAIDMAGNQGPTRTVNFRVDKTAPQITISGVSGGGTSSSQATVSFVMKELFWADSTGTVTIYRKANDNSAETLYKTINYTPTAYETVISETLTETGVYRIEFTASDWIGHQVETSQTFTIDREAPELVLTAKQNSADSEDVVKNKQNLDVPVYIGVSVTDAFYLSKQITMTGTHVNAEGTVSNLTFDGLVQSGNGTAFENIYSEDGTYTINVVTTDAAGNESSASIQFTIDNTDPVIAELPARWSGTITSFEYADPLTLVSDMTDCEVHMYINGVEYDGSEELPDGAYTLVITAEDELGHTVETSTEFVIDSQAPVFIVTGVEKDQVKNETYQITVSLQLDEDELLYVKLNGEEQAIDPNTKTCTITVDKKGNYTLEMAAKDAAGNESSDTYEFKYGEEFNWWIIVIIALAVILLGFIIFIVAKKKKSE